MKSITKVFLAAALSIAAFQGHAGQATIPNAFTSGTAAVAAQVNANFDAVKIAVDDNDARITALENTIATLQAQLAAVNNSQVMALAPYLTVDTVSDSRGPQVLLTGVNLQLVNGTGTTDGTPNGLGNLIIGYDAVNIASINYCSNGAYTDQTSCEANGETWAVSHKGGSHYLVIGDMNNYSQYAGIVNGFRNTSNQFYASVSGGAVNVASGQNSNISGGAYNNAGGSYSSVSGGWSNHAVGSTASISGGHSNVASGVYSSISGGASNTASSAYSSVSGGYYNTASGGSSSVSGGSNRSATGNYDWAAGSLWEDM